MAILVPQPPRSPSVAYSVHDLRLIAEGGAGGHGGSGGEGGDGAEAIYGKVDRDGSKGGSGGDGGDGGVGGDAAQIKLYTALPTHSVELHGGGGHAGLAGLGGKVGSGVGWARLRTRETPANLASLARRCHPSRRS
jgi:hypothetical protein